eukprot:UN27962
MDFGSGSFSDPNLDTLMQGIGVDPTTAPMTGMAEFPQVKNRPAAKSIDPAIDPDMLMPAPTTMNEQWSYKVARPAAKSIDPTNPGDESSI